MSFTPEELNILREANEKGLLTPGHMKSIVERQNTEIPEIQSKKKAIGREGVVMTGALAGAELGMRGGPRGMILGGALGAAGGSLFFDNAAELAEFAGLVEPEERTTEGIVKEATFQALTDASMATGFMAAGAALKIIGKPLIGKLAGVRTKEARDIVQQADTLGLKVGAVDVAEGMHGIVLRGGSKVLGIFPFIGGPFRKAAIQKTEKVIETTNQILNSMAPNATMADELGVNMVKAARNAMTEFNATASDLYTNFRSLARPKGAIFQTRPIKEASTEFIEAMERGRIMLDDGEELTGPVADKLGKYISQLKDLPENLNVDQLRKLTDDLQDFISQAINEGFDVKRVVTIKKSIEESMSLVKEGHPEVKEALETANTFYAKGIVNFQTPTAQKFGRVDKNMFKAGPMRPGGITDDELAKTVLNLKSKHSMINLRRLVGDENMNKAARGFIEKWWDDAIIVGDTGSIKGMDWGKFEKNFFGKGKDQQAAVEEMLKTTGSSVGQIKQLINVAKRIEIPREVNQFIARRAALGGLSSAFKGATMTALVADSFLSSMGVALLLRYGSSILSKPSNLKLMQQTLASRTTIRGASRISDPSKLAKQLRPPITIPDFTTRRVALGKLFDAVVSNE